MNPIERRIIEIYAETSALYQSVLADLGSAALGYEIMYGPVIKPTRYNGMWPLMLFMGIRPGGAASPLPGSPGVPLWPEVFDYATANYAIARRMRVAFPDQLSDCTGLNAGFLRAPKEQIYRATVPEHVRARFEAFSVAATLKIIGLLQPPMLCLVGFSTLHLFGAPSSDVLRSDGGRVLVKSASIQGIPAFAMPHPTPPFNPPRDDELRQIGAYIIGTRRRLAA